MPQNEYIELARKRFGYRLDHFERIRKRKAREPHRLAERAQNYHGLRAKLFNQKRHIEKIEMKKTIKAHEERLNKHKEADTVEEGAVPVYLLDRQRVSRAKILSNSVKQKRKEKAGKWEVPLPKVRPISEDEMFKVIKTGKRQKKGLEKDDNKSNLCWGWIYTKAT